MATNEFGWFVVNTGHQSLSVNGQSVAINAVAGPLPRFSVIELDQSAIFFWSTPESWTYQTAPPRVPLPVAVVEKELQSAPDQGQTETGRPTPPRASGATLSTETGTQAKRSRSKVSICHPKSRPAIANFGKGKKAVAKESSEATDWQARLRPRAVRKDYSDTRRIPRRDNRKRKDAGSQSSSKAPPSKKKRAKSEDRGGQATEQAKYRDQASKTEKPVTPVQYPKATAEGQEHEPTVSVVSEIELSDVAFAEPEEPQHLEESASAATAPPIEVPSKPQNSEDSSSGSDSLADLRLVTQGILDDLTSQEPVLTDLQEESQAGANAGPAAGPFQSKASTAAAIPGSSRDTKRLAATLDPPLEWRTFLRQGVERHRRSRAEELEVTEEIPWQLKGYVDLNEEDFILSIGSLWAALRDDDSGRAAPAFLGLDFFDSLNVDGESGSRLEQIGIRGTSPVLLLPILLHSSRDPGISSAAREVRSSEIGHIVLIRVSVSINGNFSIECFTSAGQQEYDHMLRRQLEACLSHCREWAERCSHLAASNVSQENASGTAFIIDPTATETIIYRQVPHQDVNTNACGVHTILNAWCLLLNIPIVSHDLFSRTSDGHDQYGRFYRQAIEIINLALAGHMDALTIHAFLVTSGYTSNVPVPRVSPSSDFYTIPNDSAGPRRNFNTVKTTTTSHVEVLKSQQTIDDNAVKQIHRATEAQAVDVESNDVLQPLQSQDTSVSQIIPEAGSKIRRGVAEDLESDNTIAEISRSAIDNLAGREERRNMKSAAETLIYEVTPKLFISSKDRVQDVSGTQRTKSKSPTKTNPLPSHNMPRNQSEKRKRPRSTQENIAATLQRIELGLTVKKLIAQIPIDPQLLNLNTSTSLAPPKHPKPTSDNPPGKISTPNQSSRRQRTPDPKTSTDPIIEEIRGHSLFDSQLPTVHTVQLALSDVGRHVQRAVTRTAMLMGMISPPKGHIRGAAADDDDEADNDHAAGIRGNTERHRSKSRSRSRSSERRSKSRSRSYDSLFEDPQYRDEMSLVDQRLREGEMIRKQCSEQKEAIRKRTEAEKDNAQKEGMGTDDTRPNEETNGSSSSSSSSDAELPAPFEAPLQDEPVRSRPRSNVKSPPASSLHPQQPSTSSQPTPSVASAVTSQTALAATATTSGTTLTSATSAMITITTTSTSTTTLAPALILPASTHPSSTRAPMPPPSQSSQLHLAPAAQQHHQDQPQSPNHNVTLSQQDTNGLTTEIEEVEETASEDLPDHPAPLSVDDESTIATENNQGKKRKRGED